MSSLKEITVNLDSYRTEGTRVFSGRKRGNAVRKLAALATLEQNYDRIRLVIPSDTIAFNPSFFLGLLGESIRSLGREGFESLYLIDAKAVFNADIDEGKQRALLESNVLRDRPDAHS